jgi:hypothetical protein
MSFIHSSPRQFFGWTQTINKTILPKTSLRNYTKYLGIAFSFVKNFCLICASSPSFPYVGKRGEKHEGNENSGEKGQKVSSFRPVKSAPDESALIIAPAASTGRGEIATGASGKGRIVAFF